MVLFFAFPFLILSQNKCIDSTSNFDKPASSNYMFLFRLDRTGDPDPLRACNTGCRIIPLQTALLHHHLARSHLHKGAYKHPNTDILVPCSLPIILHELHPSETPCGVHTIASTVHTPVSRLVKVNIYTTIGRIINRQPCASSARTFALGLTAYGVAY